MQISSLGHTECLVECVCKNGSTWRLLVDSWLSDFSVADLMERTPRVKIDWAKLPKIDAIFISHAHMDHLDPYFLTEIYQHQNPVLLLAETLEYLVPTLQKYLPNAAVEILENQKTQCYNEEIFITGLIFAEDRITNEDDVMTLHIAHAGECAYFEIDTVPPLIYEEQEKLVALFSGDYKKRIYVASANELEGNLRLLDCTSSKERNRWLKEYSEKREDEIAERYNIIVSNGLPLAQLWEMPNFELCFTGQGLQYPSALSPALAKTKIWNLEHVKNTFKEIAEEFAIHHPMKVLPRTKLPGIQFESCSEVSLEHAEIPFRAQGPLSHECRDEDAQEMAIVDALNTRFLPFKIGDSTDSLKQILILEKKRVYRIDIQYGASAPYERRQYVWGFGSTRFERADKDLGESDEVYYANDIDDFLQGKQELYCNFVHPIGKPERFWTVLGATFLNNDIVIRKYEYHFQKAKSIQKPDILSLFEV